MGGTAKIFDGGRGLDHSRARRWQALLICVTLASSLLFGSQPAEAVRGGLHEPQSFVVALTVDGLGDCTGTLVAPTKVLTAAHCLTGKSSESMRVRFAGRSVAVTNWVIHPEYLAQRSAQALLLYDLAIVSLEHQLLGPTVVPLVPSPTTAEGFIGEGVTFFGHGRNGDPFEETGVFQWDLQKTPDGAYRAADCPDIARVLCLERQPGFEAVTVAQGDSGGPWVGWVNGGWVQLAVEKKVLPDYTAMASPVSSIGIQSWIRRTAELPTPKANTIVRNGSHYYLVGSDLFRRHIPTPAVLDCLRASGLRDDPAFAGGLTRSIAEDYGVKAACSRATASLAKQNWSVGETVRLQSSSGWTPGTVNVHTTAPDGREYTGGYTTRRNVNSAGQITDWQWLVESRDQTGTYRVRLSQPGKQVTFTFTTGASATPTIILSKQNWSVGETVRLQSSSGWTPGTVNVHTTAPDGREYTGGYTTRRNVNSAGQITDWQWLVESRDQTGTYRVRLSQPGKQVTFTFTTQARQVPPRWSAEFVSQSAWRDAAFTDPWPLNGSTVTAITGETGFWRFRFRNTGNVTWQRAGANPTRLGTWNPQDRTGRLHNADWVSTNRAAGLEEQSVQPGAIGTFVVPIRAPQSVDSTRQDFNIVVDGKTWLNQHAWLILATVEAEQDVEPDEDRPDPEVEGEVEVRQCDGLDATIVGTMGDDMITGTPGRDVIAGLLGDDTILGLGGDDVICGGYGNDVIYGGPGRDILFGAQGDDRLYASDGSQGSLLSDSRGARMYGGKGDDVIYGSDRWDRMQGGLGNDRLLGFAGQDWIRGGGGSDYLDGGRAVDDMHGGNGNDSFRVGAGDSVRGGAGRRDICELSGTPASIRSCEL